MSQQVENLLPESVKLLLATITEGKGKRKTLSIAQDIISLNSNGEKRWSWNFIKEQCTF